MGNNHGGIKMKIVTTDYITGHEIDTLGLVKGNVVRSKNIGSDIGASLKSIVGGELGAYTDMMSQAREIATKRMVAEAEAMGADAIVGVRFMTSSIMQSASEVIAFGTAVKFIS